MPADLFDRFDAAWTSQRWESHSQFIRALFEALEHYELKPTFRPHTQERILRRRSEIDPVTGGWLESDKFHKKGASRAREES
jgi:hypothetical protein